MDLYNEVLFQQWSSWTKLDLDFCETFSLVANCATIKTIIILIRNQKSIIHNKSILKQHFLMGG
jgi:hypothetical protein